MKPVSIAVCDEEKAYCEEFIAYSLGHKRASVNIQVYNLREELQAQLQQQNIEVVLMTAGFWTEEILKNQTAFFVYFGEGEVCEKYKAYPYIDKYQAVDEIYQQLLRIAADHSEFDEGELLKADDKKIYGIFSPHSEEMQMYFSITMGQLFAKEQQVLYLNLMDCAGLSYVLEEDAKEDIGELLYRLRVRTGENLCCVLERMVYSYGELDYIPPVFNPEILSEVTEEEYIRMLQFILHHTEYKTIIIDFGSMTKGFHQLLMRCDKVYCLTREGFLYQSRRNHFLDYIHAAGEEALMDKIEVIYLTFRLSMQQSGRGLLEQLVWGEIGDYIRNHVMGVGVVGGAD